MTLAHPPFLRELLLSRFMISQNCNYFRFFFTIIFFIHVLTHIPISRVDPTGGLVFVVDKVGFAIVVHANVPSFRQRTILEV